MRISPLLLALSLALPFLFLSFPLWKLTAGREEAVSEGVRTDDTRETAERVVLSLRSAHVVTGLRLVQGEEVVFEAEPGAREWIDEFSLVRGRLLRLEVDWEEGAPETAVRVDLSAGFSQTYWGQGRLVEMIRVPEKEKS